MTRPMEWPIRRSKLQANLDAPGRARILPRMIWDKFRRPRGDEPTPPAATPDDDGDEPGDEEIPEGEPEAAAEHDPWGVRAAVVIPA